MYKYILTFTSLIVIFLSNNCTSNVTKSSTGNWEYINPSGKYIKAEKLWSIIKDKNIRGYNVYHETRNYGTLDENIGTYACVSYDLANDGAFLVMAFDSVDKVKGSQKDNGFKIFDKTECNIYAVLTRLTGKQNYYILVNNRILLVFYGMDIEKDRLKDIVINYDTSELVRLAK